MATAMSKQSSFKKPIERTKEVLERASRLVDVDSVTIALSGGTDSTVAADVVARYGPEYGIEPDRVVWINTGAYIPQSRLVAQTIAEMHEIEFVEQGYRNEQDAIAVRVLNNGWPGDYGGSPVTGGHGLEWANRKHKPMDEVYVNINGVQLWISGARKLESKKRQGNVPDSGIGKDKPRRYWASPIGGWTSEEKQDYIKERGLPVSEAYLFLGFSGECIACAHDNSGLLTDVELLCPEIAHALRTLAVWLYQRVKRGEVDLAPKRLCWGWDVDESEVDPEQQSLADVGVSVETAEVEQSMVGCSDENCKTMDEKPTWMLDLPDKQIVTRSDVVEYWDSGQTPERFPINS